MIKCLHMWSVEFVLRSHQFQPSLAGQGEMGADPKSHFQPPRSPLAAHH